MDTSLLGFAALHEMFNLHPMFVHLPLALIPAALLFYFLGTVFRNPSLLAAGRASLYVALAGAVVSVWTGLRAMESFPHNDIIHPQLCAKGAILGHPVF